MAIDNTTQETEQQENTTREDLQRLGVIRISMPGIFELLKLPTDYKPVGFFYNPEWNSLDFAVQHPSLPVVPEGEKLPELHPIYTRKDLPNLDHYELDHIEGEQS